MPSSEVGRKETHGVRWVLGVVCAFGIIGVSSAEPWQGSPQLWAQGSGDPSGDGSQCSLCHLPKQGDDTRPLKPHPTPKLYPLDCFDCHDASSVPSDPACFDCHEAGGQHAGLSDLGCFDCHGAHVPTSAPNLSSASCFGCHGVAVP